MILDQDGCLERVVYNVLYEYGSVIAFFLIYALILTLSICERVYFPILPYEHLVDLKDEDEKLLVDNYMIMVTGRIMLVSLILMIVSRMQSSLSWLNKRVGRFWIVRCILDNFFQHEYVHLILGWVGIIFSCILHLIFILFTPFTVDGSIANKSYASNTSQSGQYYVCISSYEYEDSGIYGMLHEFVSRCCLF